MNQYGRLVASIVASHYRVQPEMIYSNVRLTTVTTARMVSMWFIRTLFGHSYPEIGSMFKRDHTTVIYAVNTINDQYEKDPAFRSRMDQLKTVIQDACKTAPIVMVNEPPPDTISLRLPAKAREMLKKTVDKGLLGDTVDQVVNALVMLQLNQMYGDEE